MTRDDFGGAGGRREEGGETDGRNKDRIDLIYLYNTFQHCTFFL